MLSRFIHVKSSWLTVVLLVALFLNVNKPGYLQFANPGDWIGLKNWGSCPTEKIAYFPNLPFWQKSLSVASTITLWKQRLGEPICKKDGEYTWQLPGLPIFVKLFVNAAGGVTAYEFYK